MAAERFADSRRCHFFPLRGQLADRIAWALPKAEASINVGTGDGTAWVKPGRHCPWTFVRPIAGGKWAGPWRRVAHG